MSTIELSPRVIKDSGAGRAAGNHWIIYLIVSSPVLFRLTRYVISISTNGAGEPLSIIEIALILAVLYQVYARWLIQHKYPIRLSRSDVYVFLFALAAGISVIALIYRTSDYSEAINAYVRLMEFVSFYLIISTNVRSWQAIRKLMTFMVICGVAVSLLAILQYVMGPMATTTYFPWGTWWNAYEEANRFRAYSFFFNPLYVSAYVGIVWAINLGLLVSERNRTYRALYLTSLLVNCAGILITFSRSGLVGIGVALFVFAKERTRLAVAGTLLALFIGSYLIPRELRIRVFLENAESRDSIYDRLDRFKEALDLFAEHPLAGVGYGNYQNYLAGSRQYGDIGVGYIAPTPQAVTLYTRIVEGYSETAENSFLQYSGEMGIMGIVAFTALCAHFLGLLWRLRRRSSSAEGWVVGIFAGLLTFLACSMSSALMAVEMNSTFWILLGISKALDQSQPPSKTAGKMARV